MKTLRLCVALSGAILFIGAAPPALALANRVFVSARSGNNANSCDNILTPCQTFAGAVVQLNPGGEAIVLDSGGYGPVTITKSITIEAPPGVLAFIHPPSGDAVTINASGATVTLRGLTMNGGTNGIIVNSVETLNVENCFISFFLQGITMSSAGRLSVKGTDITHCEGGIVIMNGTGTAQTSIDGCHLDGNGYGFYASTTSPGSSTTSASHTTANNNFGYGWVCGIASTGKDVLNLEFCTASENLSDGLIVNSANAQSVARYSNCAFANNGGYGVSRASAATMESRGNNTITGNASGETNGVIGAFAPM